MSNNQPPPGYGYPTNPPQQPYGQPGYGQPGYPPPPYGQPQQPYPQPYPQQPQYQLPPWLAPQNPFGPPTPGTRTLASAGDRFLARLIDTGVTLVPLVVLWAITAGAGYVLATFASGAVLFVYEAAMMLTQHGQTLGKKAMKLRVVSLAHGGRPTDAELWTRSAVAMGPQAVYCLGTLFWLLDVLWHLWDKPFQQCLHDKPAKTVVVKEG